jgi:transposase-like protein
MVNLNQSENNCPNCNSQEINYHKNFNFYRCKACYNSWTYEQNEPDYEEFQERCPDCGSTNISPRDYANYIDGQFNGQAFSCTECCQEWIEEI